MRDDRLYLIHIQECIERIVQYTVEGENSFFADTKTQDAVIRNLQTLAESTQRISDFLKADHPGIDWRSIASFRNMVVHDYLGIDPRQIWDIVEGQLPQLKNQVEAMLRELGETP